MFARTFRLLTAAATLLTLALPAAAQTTTQPLCPSGYALSGTSCRAQLTCPAGSTASGGQCSRTTTTTYRASCPAGTQLWSNFCAAYDFKLRGPSTTRYPATCSRGGMLGSSGMCSITSSTTSKLSCPAGGWPIAGLYCTAPSYCPTGYRLSGTVCRR